MGSIDDHRHSDNGSLDDLSAIQNLLFEEGFEDMHSSISRREQIRNALASRASSVTENLSPSGANSRMGNDDNAESKLLRIVMSQTNGGGDDHSPGAVGGPHISPLSRKRSTSSRRRNVDGSGALDRKLGGQLISSAPTIVVVRHDGDDRSTGTTGNSSRHSTRQRRTGTKREGGRDSHNRDRRNITDEGPQGSSRSRSRHRSKSPRRSSSVVSRKSSQKGPSSVVSTSSRRRRSESLGPSRGATLSDDDLTEGSNLMGSSRKGKSRQGRKESSRSYRRSSSLRPAVKKRLSTATLDNLDDLNKSLDDLGIAGLHTEQHPTMRRQLSVPSLANNRKSRTDRKGSGRNLRRSNSVERQKSDQPVMIFGNDSKSMLETALDGFMVDINAESTHAGTAESITTGTSSQHSKSYLVNGSTGTSSAVIKAKKTKLEKIHELQAKCDHYKKEWSDASKDKRYYRKELDASKLLVASLSKQLETHMLETSFLQKNLSESLEQLEATRDEQRNRDERKRSTNSKFAGGTENCQRRCRKLGGRSSLR
jgi:hypothetical protein